MHYYITTHGLNNETLSSKITNLLLFLSFWDHEKDTKL